MRRFTRARNRSAESARYSLAFDPFAICCFLSTHLQARSSRIMPRMLRARICVRYQAVADASVDKNRSLASGGDMANYDISMLESYGYTILLYRHVRRICLIARGRLEI